MFVFVALSLALIKTKNAESIEELKQSEIKWKESNLLLIKQLEAILNTPTTYQEAEQKNQGKIKDLLLSSFEVFNNQQGKEFLKRVRDTGSLNNLYRWQSGYNLDAEIGTKKAEGFREINKIIIKEIGAIHNNFCSKFFLGIPQGIITKKSLDEESFVYAPSLFGQNEDYATIKIPYLDFIIEVKYKKEC